MAGVRLSLILPSHFQQSLLLKPGSWKKGFPALWQIASVSIFDANTTYVSSVYVNQSARRTNIRN
jgi:hypothetical protein